MVPCLMSIVVSTKTLVTNILSTLRVQAWRLFTKQKLREHLKKNPQYSGRRVAAKRSRGTLGLLTPSLIPNTALT